MAKCSERGCVFPALDGSKVCALHQREIDEPRFFQSIQPTAQMMHDVISRGRRVGLHFQEYNSLSTGSRCEE